MKQVQQNYRSGELKVADVPAPRAGAGCVLVATRVSLISSGTEKQLMDLAKASLAGKAMARPDLVRRVVRNVQRDGLRPTIEKVFAKLDTPIPLGYSIAGEVLEVGRSVPWLRAGDRVASPVPARQPCRDQRGPEESHRSNPGCCDRCGRELRHTRRHRTSRRPPSRPTLGERIVVMGLGLIGLLTVQLLKANGCRVLGFDPNPQRAALARELGADMAISDGLARRQIPSPGYGADAVIIPPPPSQTNP